MLSMNVLDAKIVDYNHHFLYFDFFINASYIATQIFISEMRFFVDAGNYSCS